MELTKDRVGPFGTNDYQVVQDGETVGVLYRWYTGKVRQFPGKRYLWSFAPYVKGLSAQSWGTFKDARSAINAWQS